jgi:beta-lactamase class A
VVDGFTAAQPVAFSVVVVDLSTGAQAAHLADRSVLSASLYKLFVARELIRRVDAGELDGDAPAGDTMNRTVDRCVDAMIMVSDNACGAAGLRMVGGGALDDRLHREGFVSTSLASHTERVRPTSRSSSIERAAARCSVLAVKPDPPCSTRS